MSKRRYRNTSYRNVPSYHDNKPKYVGITSKYFMLNWYRDEYYPCESLNHACAIAFGRNKSTRNQNCLACVRTADYFVCL